MPGIHFHSLDDLIEKIVISQMSSSCQAMNVCILSAGLFTFLSKLPLLHLETTVAASEFTGLSVLPKEPLHQRRYDPNFFAFPIHFQSRLTISVDRLAFEFPQLYAHTFLYLHRSIEASKPSPEFQTASSGRKSMYIELSVCPQYLDCNDTPVCETAKVISE